MLAFRLILFLEGIRFGWNRSFKYQFGDHTGSTEYDSELKLFPQLRAPVHHHVSGGADADAAESVVLTRKRFSVGFCAHRARGIATAFSEVALLLRRA